MTIPIWAFIIVFISIFMIGAVAGSFAQDRFNKKDFYDVMSRAFADKIERLHAQFEKEKEALSEQYAEANDISRQELEAKYASDLNLMTEKHIADTKALETRLQNEYANDLSTFHVECKTKLAEIKAQHEQELTECNEYWENREKAMKLISSSDETVADVELIWRLLNRAKVYEPIDIPELTMKGA